MELMCAVNLRREDRVMGCHSHTSVSVGNENVNPKLIVFGSFFRPTTTTIFLIAPLKLLDLAEFLS